MATVPAWGGAIPLGPIPGVNPAEVARRSRHQANVARTRRHLNKIFSLGLSRRSPLGVLFGSALGQTLVSYALASRSTTTESDADVEETIADVVEFLEKQRTGYPGGRRRRTYPTPIRPPVQGPGNRRPPRLDPFRLPWPLIIRMIQRFNEDPEETERKARTWFDRRRRRRGQYRNV